VFVRFANGVNNLWKSFLFHHEFLAALDVDACGQIFSISRHPCALQVVDGQIIVSCIGCDLRNARNGVELLDIEELLPFIGRLIHGLWSFGHLQFDGDVLLASQSQVIDRGRNLGSYSEGIQVRTTLERTISDVRHGIGDGDACKAGAIRERTHFNACHGIGDGDACKSGATFERMPSNACHRIRDGYTRKAAATSERIISDARHGIGNYSWFASYN